ncbi:hypothetical protein [Enterobacter cloacae]|uniref:hypothetical protein n=1 Tax=Enterobacter cloacae TaxID=550 RepID=UPI001E5BBA88|nr:hypothetical protein [Enterobacter cloacae]
MSETPGGRGDTPHCHVDFAVAAKSLACSDEWSQVVSGTVLRILMSLCRATENGMNNNLPAARLPAVRRIGWFRFLMRTMSVSWR